MKTRRRRDPASRPQHACDFSGGLRNLRQKHQAEAAGHCIERVRFKRKGRLRCPYGTSHSPGPRVPSACVARQRASARRGPDPITLPARPNGLCAKERGIAGARTKIENLHARSQSSIGHEPVIEEGHLIIEETIPFLPAVRRPDSNPDVGLR